MDIVGIAELEQKFSIGDSVMVYPENYDFSIVFSDRLSNGWWRYR